jgi:hypothetical protein
MDLLRNRWPDLGGLLAAVVAIGLFLAHGLSPYRQLLWVSLITLFLHQLEEYRFPGTFPGMINRAVFHSDAPDRYPLNTNTALIVNAGLGWLLYLLAAIVGQRAVWLGMATILISLGNLLAHTLFFNLRQRSFYNAGMATSWLLFAPCIVLFFRLVHREHLASPTDYGIGIALGIVLNVFGILKMITGLADRNTPYVFAQRNLLPQDRTPGAT